MPILWPLCLSLFVSTMLAVILAPDAFAASPEMQAASASDSLQKALEGLVDEGSLPGAVVVIARGDRQLAEAQVGYQDVAAAKPMTEDTIFRLYSMSKPITSVATMMLIEEGRLSLDQPVASILPSFRAMRVFESGTLDDMVTVPAERPITVKDLLSHKAGITYHFAGNTPVHAYYRRNGVMRDTPVGRSPEDGEPAASLDELVARLAGAPLLHQPGTTFSYSYATTILGKIIERVSGQTLDAFLHERVFEPLGMVDTGFFIADEDLDRFATNYVMTDNTLREIETPHMSEYRNRARLLDGGGALAGTARDYLRFASMLARGGELNGRRLLSQESVREMFQPHAEIEGLGVGFGFGFSLGTEATESAGMLPAGAVGWWGSANTFFWLWPDTELVVVFMTQVITPPAFDAESRRFRFVLHDAVRSMQTRID